MPVFYVIDDDVGDVKPLGHLLEESGCVVRFVDSVAKAHEALIKQRKSCDVAIVDIVMPTDGLYKGCDTDDGALTGVRFLEVLVQERPEVTLVALTIRGDEDIVGRLRALNVAMHIRKPFFIFATATQLLGLVGVGPDLSDQGWRDV